MAEHGYTVQDLIMHLKSYHPLEKVVLEGEREIGGIADLKDGRIKLVPEDEEKET